MVHLISSCSTAQGSKQQCSDIREEQKYTTEHLGEKRLPSSDSLHQHYAAFALSLLDRNFDTPFKKITKTLFRGFIPLVIIGLHTAVFSMFVNTFARIFML